MKAFLQNLRFRLEQQGIFPRSRLSRAAWYLLGLDIALFLLEMALHWFSLKNGGGLRGWVTLLSFAVIILFVLVGIRWVRQKLMWRLRNRLIVTYMFIGVIPVILLLTMAFVSLYLFAGQYANFVVLSELDARLRGISASNMAVAAEMAREIDGKQPVGDFVKELKLRDPEWKKRSVCVFENDKVLLCDEGIRQFQHAAISLGNRIPGGIVNDHDRLDLRAATTLPEKFGKLTVISSEPLDEELLSSMAKNLGVIYFYHSIQSPDSDSHVAVEFNGNNTNVKTTTAGSLPAQSNILDREISFFTPVRISIWTATGALPDAPGINALGIHTRPSLLYDRLFSALGEASQVVEYFLVVLAIILAIIEIVALYIGTRLTRTVTGAVAQLYSATTFVNQGDLSHRIPVQSSDQLASLATSFNAMTASLENLLEEQRDKQKLENELIIAQEVQSQLFPRVISQVSSLDLHGFCRPARTVSGDYYDFLTVDPETLIFAVGDVSGKGISAALLMATIHSAVRAYSIEGIPLVRQMMAAGAAELPTTTSAIVHGAEVSPSYLLSLLNHQLYASTPQEKYATLFLAFYDGRRRKLTYSNAGHLPPMVISEDGTTRRLDCGGTVVGLFDDVRYEEASIFLRPGEIFLAYSDGVTEPENDYGEFGEERLLDLVYENRHHPLSTISETVTLALDDWIGAREQPDDVTLVLARAR
ncbi:MAG TPA: SpoIIE family protein phosphatase [Terriglobales bacterium]|jgi:sigma-B regulation protein RsbU (phosphoserine phosphatase)